VTEQEFDLSTESIRQFWRERSNEFEASDLGPACCHAGGESDSRNETCIQLLKIASILSATVLHRGGLMYE
jgi:hypothetical protein